MANLGILVAGSLLGTIIGFLIARLFSLRKGTGDSQLQKIKVDLQLEKERNAQLQKDIQNLNEDLRKERGTLIDLNAEKSRLEANYQNLQEKIEGQKEELAQIQEKFAFQFKHLANEIFEEKTKKFTDQNKNNLGEILKPLGEKLNDFERKVEQSNKESLERSAALREQIIGLRELNKKMSEEAENLTKALKGDTRIQGNWGELVLERILEQSGLEKDREYFLQESFQSEAGRRLRPDVIIKLPDKRNLIIDAKASLVAYEKYMNTEDESEKEQFLKEHILSVRTHIKTLSEKNYQQLFDGGALDYILMFIPIESAFALVVQHGGELYNEAHNRNIIIVSPATLIATLRTVASIWKHEYQNKNALEIARQGGALYDKFKAFVDDLIEVGQSLDRSKTQYSAAMNKLVEGRDNLIRKTERLKELGAKASKSMDDKLLDRANVLKETEKPEPPNLFKQ